MVLGNQLFPNFNLMNSPQPLSALQRGAKKLHSPFFCTQEKGVGGLSSCILKIFRSFCYSLPIVILYFSEYLKFVLIQSSLP